MQRTRPPSAAKWLNWTISQRCEPFIVIDTCPLCYPDGERAIGAAVLAKEARVWNTAVAWCYSEACYPNKGVCVWGGVGNRCCHPTTPTVHNRFFLGGLGMGGVPAAVPTSTPAVRSALGPPWGRVPRCVSGRRTVTAQTRVSDSSYGFFRRRRRVAGTAGDGAARAARPATATVMRTSSLCGTNWNHTTHLQGSLCSIGSQWPNSSRPTSLQTSKNW